MTEQPIKKQFVLTVDESGYGIETNLTKPELAYWLGILTLKCQLEILEQDTPA